jgi:hypothetical protein
MFERAIMQVKKSEEEQQALDALGKKVEEDQLTLDKLSEELMAEQRTIRELIANITDSHSCDTVVIDDDIIANKDENLTSAVKPVDTDSIKFIVKDSIWFLDEAKRIQEERGAIYDSTGSTKERSMGKTVTAFNSITGKDLTEAEGWLLLQLLKDARQWANPNAFHLDSATDGVSYSSLKAEALAANK